MKHLKDIKNKIKWEKYYDPNFNWHNENFYKENVLSENFIKEFKNKVNWYDIVYFQKLSEGFIR
jgi:hypothetical protein